MPPLTRKKQKRTLEDTLTSFVNLQEESNVIHVDQPEPQTSRSASRQKQGSDSGTPQASSSGKKRASPSIEVSEPVNVSSRKNRNEPNTPPVQILHESDPVAPTGRAKRKERQTPASQGQDIEAPEPVISTGSRPRNEPQTSTNVNSQPTKLFSALSISQMFNQYMSIHQCVPEKKLNRLVEGL